MSRSEQLSAICAPSKEEMDRWEADRLARQKDPSPREKLLQNTTLLSVWLERCAKAGIPAVPATFSAGISTQEIFDAIDGHGEALTIDAAMKWIQKNRGLYSPAEAMWRWEQCAPMDLKLAMSKPGGIAKWVDFSIDDPRLFDILYECNVAETKVCVRPIVDVETHAGYPVEFRCYIFGEGQVAVSSYYPQRPLSSAYSAVADVARSYASSLFKYVNSPFTADFCETPDGVIFLEGGPPMEGGAHPCCFDPEKLAPGRTLMEREEGSMGC